MSTIVGITVLPARLTRVAPAGTRTSAVRPTAVMRAPVTRKVAFSMGASVADDDARAFEGGDAGLSARGRSEDSKDTKGKCCSKSGDVHAAHRYLHGESGRPYCSSPWGKEEGGEERAALAMKGIGGKRLTYRSTNGKVQKGRSAQVS